MFQVLVKTTPHMKGSYSFDCVEREAAEVLVRRSDVWWYCFPVDEEVMDGSSWHKGGAWDEPSLTQEVADATAVEDFMAEYVTPPARPYEEEDDERW